MTTVEQLPSRPDWLDVLIARSTRFDGQPPFSDGSLVDVAQGRRRILAIGDVAAALVAPNEAELVVDPDARRHGHGAQLVEAILGTTSGELRVWAHGDHPAARALAARFGATPERELLQLRLSLPVEGGFDTVAARPTQPTEDAVAARPTQPTEDTVAARPTQPAVDTVAARPTQPAASASTSSASVGPFDAARDADDWVALNSRAFALHPEQGAVTRSDLDTLTVEPWFDADDFLVLRDGDAMVGYCWLKVEHGSGEFYVVGVDPERQGEGLGRRLVEAGLARLATRGIRTASLYVDADNAQAVRLYRSFGFTNHTVDVQYVLRGTTRSSVIHAAMG